MQTRTGRGGALTLNITIGAALMVLTLTSCGEDGQGDIPLETSPPDWVERVIPEPGATAAVPDAIEVHHRITGPDEDVRLIVDGVDVTAYSSFDAVAIRYETYTGPVELGPGEHWAEVQYVSLPAFGGEMVVVDSYRWEFRLD